MAANFPHGLFLWIFVAFCSCLFRFSSCQPSGYSQAVATFYINPTSPGSGGACGLENDVPSAPYNAMITAGNQALFKQGAGCGACYQNPHCSGNPITLTLTDECPGACNNDPVHFDISGIAFGKLAKSGEASQLYNAGRISIFYRRVACNYNTNIIFKVDKGSNPNFFAVTSEAVDGDGPHVRAHKSVKLVAEVTWGKLAGEASQKRFYSRRSAIASATLVIAEAATSGQGCLT
uniref:Expansin-B15-like n=1 Tax=Nicotiana tabacum TaxID=4097 RepID=A0A1S4C1W3_TOBAC